MLGHRCYLQSLKCSQAGKHPFSRVSLLYCGREVNYSNRWTYLTDYNEFLDTQDTGFHSNPTKAHNFYDLFT